MPDVAAPLPGIVARMIAGPATHFPVCGAALLAVAMTRDDPVRARMIALAERLRYQHGFQPTMAADRIRGATERSAYLDAVSRYADLDQAGLRAEVLALLSGSGHGGTAPAPTGNRPAPTPHTT